MTAPKFCKTKIIATIGPSSWDRGILRNMIEAGMDLARVNSSFADYNELKRVKDSIRSLSPRISLILDTMGNKIRVKGFKDIKEISKGETLILIPTTQKPSSQSEIQITYNNLHNELSRGAKILLDDGKLKLIVKDIKNHSVICTAQNSHRLEPRKTVNIPNQKLNLPLLTEKDIQDIKYAKELEYDFVALSFVQNKEIVFKTREILNDSSIKIISKIENQIGLDNFDEILHASDAIMIARGDLGVEIPFEKIPVIQKQLIYRCRMAGKPVIVATQMLESMHDSPQATRAEVNDVANSIADGTDAVMLSSETATGKYPVESVKSMNSIALAMEDILTPQVVYGNSDATKDTDEICRSVFALSNSIDLKAILVISQSGKTVKSLARHRPTVPIYEISNDIHRVREDNLLRGVKCYFSNNLSDDRDLNVQNATEVVFSYGELDFNDKIAIISGSTIKNKESNTILEISTVKDIINK
jgi:pyruvate kinase